LAFWTPPFRVSVARFWLENSAIEDRTTAAGAGTKPAATNWTALGHRLVEDMGRPARLAGP
jgi:hypothetical protein